MAKNAHALAHQFIEALHMLEHGQEGALERLVALFGDDAELVNPILKLDDRQCEGREHIGHFWNAYRGAIGQAHSEFSHVTVDEQAAGLFWTTKGTATNGEAMEYEGVSLLVFDDTGKIVRFRAYYDTRELNQAIGLGRE